MLFKVKTFNRKISKNISSIFFSNFRNEVFDGPNVEYVEEAEDTLESVLNMNVDEVAEKW